MIFAITPVPSIIPDRQYNHLALLRARSIVSVPVELEMMSTQINTATICVFGAGVTSQVRVLMELVSRIDSAGLQYSRQTFI